jgi:uncharacterized protein YjbI with pentapeptide repeats
MKFEIRNRWSGAVQYTCELSADVADKSYSVQLGFAVRKAVAEKADLRAANLSDADLSDADLSDADLRAANLSDANLHAANLSDANLHAANLSAADLSAANLSDADLRAANLKPIRADFYDVLAWAPSEVPGLIAALKEGRVDGSTYTGTCACLVGTIANIRGVDVDVLPQDSYRPIERFFMSIRKGHTPENNQHSAIALEWAQSWLDTMQAAFAPKAA